MNFIKQNIKTTLVTSLALGMSYANAAVMALPAELTDALGSVAVIGAGVFAIAVGVKVYKWARGAL